MSKASYAVTVSDCVAPAVCVAAPVSRRVAAAAAEAAIVDVVPVIDGVVVSVAVMVRLPDCRIVAANVWLPLSAPVKV